MGQGSSAAMSYGVGHGRGSDPAPLRPRRRPAAAAPIQPLAWEPPRTIGVALKTKKASTVGAHVAKGRGPPLLSYNLNYDLGML